MAKGEADLDGGEGGPEGHQAQDADQDTRDRTPRLAVHLQPDAHPFPEQRGANDQEREPTGEEQLSSPTNRERLRRLA